VKTWSIEVFAFVSARSIDDAKQSKWVMPLKVFHADKVLVK
jgi:hypothetical protein